jgi:peptidoglycan/LPS O-acetylase OafA/YrhL
MKPPIVPAAVTQGAPPESQRPRILHLDGLRGLAAFGVVMDHYFGPMASEPGVQHWVGRLANTGWLGVDVFFTLSGFLITGILLDEPKRKGYFSRFYIRRAFRLAPLYYSYLAIIAVLGFATHTPNKANLLSDVFYLQDFYIALVGHWVTGTGLLWSLAIEEQFYLVWPTAVYRWKPRTLAPLILIVGVLSIALRSAMQLTGRGFAAYVFPFSHLDGLCLGALLALAVREVDPFQLRRFFRVAPWIAIPGLLALYPFAGDPDNNSTPLFGGIAPILVAVLTASLILQPGKFVKVLTSEPLRWLGRYSYAFYVLQLLPGIVLQHWLFQKTHSLALRSAGNLLFIALLALEARLSWAILEGPMLKLRERLFSDRLEPRDSTSSRDRLATSTSSLPTQPGTGC